MKHWYRSLILEFMVAITMTLTTNLPQAAVYGADPGSEIPAAGGNHAGDDREPVTITLFPNGAPGEATRAIGPEKDTSPPDGGPVAGKRVIRLGDVSVPTITVYRPKDHATGAAVVVCPGGGYSILAYDLEGTEVCEYLNSIGVTAILLKYRVPARPGGQKYDAPLQDTQRAVGIVRSRAAEFGIAPNKIGILGFSAGGHLAALLSNAAPARTYDAIDAADRVSCRPDFTVLVYPAYLYAKDQPNHLAPELHVSRTTPPAFLAQAEDDSSPVENTVYYFLALKEQKVSAELHVLPRGGHGYGLRPSHNAIPTAWPKLLADWLRENGWLGASR